MTDSESLTSRADASLGPRSRRTDRLWGPAVAVLALAGAGLVLLSTAKYGAGLSNDSVGYLDVARNLVSGRGLVFSGRWYVHNPWDQLVWWPPLYPAVLALIGFATRLDPTICARFVNAALFAFVVHLSACLFRTGSRQTTIYRALGVCAVLFSPPLSEVYGWAWSECLFIPLLLFYLISAQRYWNSGSVLALAVMALATALACLTRYIGVVLVAAGALTIILASGKSFKTRLNRAFAFTALSLAPLGFWAVRNYRLTETLFGDRGPFRSTFADIVVVSAKTMLSWYVFGPVPKLFVAALVAVLAILLLSLRAGRARLSSSLRVVLSDHPAAVLLLAAFAVVLPLAAMRDAVVDSRMWSPVYVPATYVLLHLAYSLLSSPRPVPSAAAGRFPAILLALWLCFPLANVVRTTAARFRDGAGGYSIRTWRESATIAYARQVLRANADVPVYSNGPDALMELARVSVTLTPYITAGSLSDLEGKWPAEKGSVLVWFRNVTWRPYLFTLEELKEVANAVEVARFSDGSFYRVSAKETSVSEPSRGVGEPAGRRRLGHAFLDSLRTIPSIPIQ